MSRLAPAMTQVRPAHHHASASLNHQTTDPGSPVRQAAQTLMYILRDMLACSVIMWLVTYLCAHGDLLFTHTTHKTRDGSPPSGSGPNASEESFVFSVLAYTSLFSAALITLVQSSALLAFHFTRSPTRKPRLGFCLWRVLRYCYVGYVVSLLGIAGSAGLLGTRWSAVVREYKLHYYGASFFLFFYYVVVDNAGRHIYLTETVEGTTRARTLVAAQRRRSYWRTFAGTMVKDRWHLGLVYIAGGYVYIASSLELSRPLPSILFSAVSTAIKMATQELIKRSVMKHRARGNIYAIYISVVGITVLMDTQVRVALIKMSGFSVTATLFQAVALAPVEIFVRFVRAHHLRLQITRRQLITCGQSGQRQQTQEDSMDLVAQPEPRAQRQEDFEQWRKGVIRIQAAEIHADMCAEYLAILCSTLLYSFYRDNPRYGQAFKIYSSSGRPSEIRLSLVSLQVALKVLVDLCCCVYEIREGIQFHVFGRMRLFVTVLYVAYSVLNIAISSIFYVRA